MTALAVKDVPFSIWVELKAFGAVACISCSAHHLLRELQKLLFFQATVSPVKAAEEFPFYLPLFLSALWCTRTFTYKGEGEGNAWHQGVQSCTGTVCRTHTPLRKKKLRRAGRMVSVQCSPSDGDSSELPRPRAGVWAAVHCPYSSWRRMWLSSVCFGQR